MKFIISASTDVGISKSVNEDSAFIRRLMTPSGEAVFAAVCDGVGGLNSGEIASGSVIAALNRWFSEEFPIIYEQGLTDRSLFQSWFDLVHRMNLRIREYGLYNGIRLGTTLASFLIVRDSCYIMNVGDSRVYELSDQVRVLTHDQTLVAQEVEQGILTPEEASMDVRQNIILQCIGESEQVFPEFRAEPLKHQAVYMACSDGFRHKISKDELLKYLGPHNLTEAMLKEGQEYLINLNISRDEQDNISVVAARPYDEEDGCGIN